MASWPCLKAAKVITISDLIAEGFVLLWCHYCSTQAGEANIHCQKPRHLHKCDKLSYYPCLCGHRAPRAKDRLHPLICAQHAAMVHAGAQQGAPCTPTTSWKDKPVKHESCPMAGSLLDQGGLPIFFLLPY